MDIQEFEKQQQPRARRSKLDKFREEIFKLREKGYANWQVRDWLQTNGITVTQESVRRFVKSRKAMPQQSLPKASEQVSSVPALPAPEDEDLSGLTLKQRAERRADQFVTEKPVNSIAQQLLKGK